jgi:hypothetical protein
MLGTPYRVLFAAVALASATLAILTAGAFAHMIVSPVASRTHVVQP